MCGTVEAVGDDVAALGVGDRVVTAQADGAYAEYCTAPADFVRLRARRRGVRTWPQPSLLKGMTAHYLIKSVYPVQQGDTVLVHAGAGGVGLILTQWATSLAVRGDHHRVDAGEGRAVPAGGRGGGARLPRRSRGVRRQDPDLTDGGGVAAVYDGVGAATFEASLASLAVRGTLALFGAASGPVPPFDPQRLNAAGSVFLTRPTWRTTPARADEFSWRAGELLDAIADGHAST